VGKNVYSDSLPQFWVTTCLACRDILLRQGALPHETTSFLFFPESFGSPCFCVAVVSPPHFSQPLEKKKKVG
jgi:hypothetical protein